MSQYKSLILLIGAMALAACAPSIPDPDPQDNAGGSFGDDSGMSGDGYDDGMDAGGSLDPADMGGELEMVIYFEFDSSEIRPQDVDTVAGHAQQLSQMRGLQVRLEGHADERGSREYNIGLGERRAQAVRRLLLLQGASASQISTVSFGEERPEATGSNESAYARNRRVVFNFTR